MDGVAHKRSGRFSAAFALCILCVYTLWKLEEQSRAPDQVGINAARPLQE